MRARLLRDCNFNGTRKISSFEYTSLCFRLEKELRDFFGEAKKLKAFNDISTFLFQKSKIDLDRKQVGRSEFTLF